MDEAARYRALLLAWILTAAGTFVTLFFRTAPYGRHGRAGWGPGVPARLAWVLMEAPAAVTILVVALPAQLAAPRAQTWLLLALWELHYVNRAFVYPLRQRSTATVPISVIAMANVFNLCNGWLIGGGITRFGPELGVASLGHPRMLLGVSAFLVGMWINWDADARLFRLRAAEAGYAIPRGGLYERISCPNYLGEMIEWLGFAIASGSLAAFAFFLWTIANLAPRAIAHHRWYKEKFPDYPVERRALVPYLW